MKKIGSLILLTVLLFSTLVSFGSASAENTDLERVDKEYFDIFDTRILASIWVSDDQDSLVLLDGIESILKDMHEIATKYDAVSGVNNVHYINENPGVEIEVNPDLITLIQMGIDVYNHDSKTFNIALGKVLNIWSAYRENCLLDGICDVPTTEELEAAFELANPNLIEIDSVNNTVKIPEGLELDLGAVAKGYAAELVGNYLRSAGVTAFLINAGDSNIEVYGKNPNPHRDFWSIGLKNPNNPSAIYGRIHLNSGDNAITSGDYDRYYTVDGQDYHHLIDPNTLFPAYYTRTVTVVAANPGLGDVYSTIAFLLPIDEGIEFIDAIEGVEAIWFDYNENIHFSENFETLYLDEILIKTNDSETFFTSCLGSSAATQSNFTMALSFAIPMLALLTVFSVLRLKKR